MNYIYECLFINETRKSSYNKMIGNIDELTEINNKPKPSYVIIIPLCELFHGEYNYSFDINNLPIRDKNILLSDYDYDITKFFPLNLKNIENLNIRIDVEDINNLIVINDNNDDKYNDIMNYNYIDNMSLICECGCKATKHGNFFMNAIEYHPYDDNDNNSDSSD